MPLVVIKTDLTDSECGEEILSEYLCDWPDCADVAVHAVGTVRELGSSFVVCSQHAAQLEAAARDRTR
jgi:hypothetical protein